MHQHVRHHVEAVEIEIEDDQQQSPEDLSESWEHVVYPVALRPAPLLMARRALLAGSRLINWNPPPRRTAFIIGLVYPLSYLRRENKGESVFV